ncbi:MAG TPA: hypothetical protein VFA45_12335 [Actinomycetes bacterium]|nr:hypothetical protein [Actinomycetes bacterium]
MGVEVEVKTILLRAAAGAQLGDQLLFGMKGAGGKLPRAPLQVGGAGVAQLDGGVIVEVAPDAGKGVDGTDAKPREGRGAADPGAQEDGGRSVDPGAHGDQTGMDRGRPPLDDRGRPNDPVPPQQQPIHERVADHTQPPAPHWIEIGEGRVPAAPFDDVDRVRRNPDILVEVGEVAAMRDSRRDHGVQRRPAKRGQLLVGDGPDAQLLLCGGNERVQLVRGPAVVVGRRLATLPCATRSYATYPSRSFVTFLPAWPSHQLRLPPPCGRTGAHLGGAGPPG